MKKPSDNSIMVMALWAIFFALLSINYKLKDFVLTKSDTTQEITESVVSVVGRATTAFDGPVSKEIGFLVKDGDSLYVLPFDSGSLAATDGFKPKYMKVVKRTNGDIIRYEPLAVSTF